ncbi:hypothetical protein F66182_12776, partial [Fusarium sp. NRRL 66182]
MAEITISEPVELPENTQENTEIATEQLEELSNTQTALAQTSTTDQENALVPTTTATDGEVGQKKTKKIIRRKKRPARPQVDPSTIKSEPPPQTGTIFNIWYNKWSGGDREDKYLSKTAAAGRCNVAKDSGYTRADKVTGSYFCLFFARGI